MPQWQATRVSTTKEQDTMAVSKADNGDAPTSALGRFFSGATFGLAQTYWGLFAFGSVIFFIAGSLLASERDWIPYTALLAGSIAYTFALLIGVQRHYRGSDPGKALGRIGMLFLLLNLTNMLATLSFI
jgi:hypothetical protein